MPAFPSFPWLQRRGGGDPGPWCRTGLGRAVSLEAAVADVARQLAGAGPADLALVFASSSYASDLPRLLPLLQQKLQAAHWLGCVGGGVVGTEAGGEAHEHEHEPALSVTLLGLPGASLHPSPSIRPPCRISMGRPNPGAPWWGRPMGRPRCCCWSTRP